MREVIKVLVVDDEELIRQGVINYLDWEAEGFIVVGSAANGKEALEIIEEVRPHVIITDVVMPIMDGIELVKTVKEKYPDIAMIVLSSFEDYEYVRSTFQSGVVDYILKPNISADKLLATLKEAVKNIPSHSDASDFNFRHHSIENLISRQLLGQELQQDKHFKDYHFLYKNFRLLEIVLNEHQEIEKEVNKFKQELKKKFFHMNTYSVKIPDIGVFILLNYHYRHDSKLEEEIQIILSENRFSFSIILSECFTNIYDLHSIYQGEVLSLKNCLFYLPDYKLISNNLLPPIKKENKKFVLNHFIDIFKARQFNAAFNYASEYIKYLSNQYYRNQFEFKSFIGNLMFNMIVLLDNLDVDVESLDADKYHYFSEVNESNTINKVMETYHHFIDRINEIIFRSGTVKNQSDIQKILIYIEKNYDQPLSLTKVAEHFHYNSSYLSYYFSTQLNEGFNEYLNRIRIKKSMDLLKNSTLSIADISGMVGYSSHSYFGKVFKKITGMSPSEYRREHQSNDKENF